MALSKGQKATAGGVAAALALATPLVMTWEGKRNDPYFDIVKVRTVCYGETQVKMRRYSDAECKAMLVTALEQRYMRPVLACTPTLAGRPYQLAAASSLAYNIGSVGYCASTAARNFNANNFPAGCAAMTRFNRAGGKIVRGLVNRRQDEYRLCMKGLV